MAECPECGSRVKVAPGKLAVCPKCDMKFRAPADDERKTKPSKKDKDEKNGAKPPARADKPAAKPKPAADEGAYGFSPDEVDLAKVRAEREEEDKKKQADKAKKDKPIIEIKRKNIGDLKVWERIDKSMIWFLSGVAVWCLAHLLYGLVLFLGMVQGPEFAGPVVNKLIQPNQPPLQLGAGDALDRPAFIVAMLGGLNNYSLTMALLIVMVVLGWVRQALWLTGYSIAWPSAPADVSGKGQLITLYTLTGLNFVLGFFLYFLPLIGAYPYCPVPWMGSELAMAEFNMERSLPLHVFWAFAPFWETLLGFLLMTLMYFEPIMIAYFVWSVASSIKDDALEKASLGTVKMGFAVLFLLLAYQLFALAGTSPVLVQVLRLLYLMWYAALIVWMLRLVTMIGKCREMFHFYFHPEED
jgi:hypothetical protein